MMTLVLMLDREEKKYISSNLDMQKYICNIKVQKPKLANK
jgi:hypothetical protein